MEATLEVFTDVPSSDGARRVCPIYPYIEGQAEHELDHSGVLRLVAPRHGVDLRDLWWIDLIDIGQVVRHLNHVDHLNFWRIFSIDDGFGAGLEDRVVIEARPMIYDLKDVLIFEEVQGGAPVFNLGADGGSPAQFADTFIIPKLHDSGRTWITRGTWTPTLPFRSPFDAFNCLELTQEIGSRTGYEPDLRPDGDDGFLLDMAIINDGVTTNPADLRRNVITIGRERKDQEFYTVILPRGMQAKDEPQPATRAYATFRVDTVTADTPTPGLTTITLEARNGGAGPILYDFQFGGHGLAEFSNSWALLEDGSLVEIISCTAATQTIVLDGSGPSVNDDIEIRADQFGTFLAHMFNPDSVGDYGVKWGRDADDELRGERNWVKNPFGTEETGGVPDDWTEGGTAELVQVPVAFGETETGAADGAQASTLSLDVTGFPAGHVIYPGDAIYGTSSNHSFCDTEVTLDGSGAGTISVGVAISVSDAEVLTTERPDVTDWAAGEYLTWVNPDGLNDDMSTTAVTIVPPTGGETVHFRAGVTYFNTGSGQETPGGPTLDLHDGTSVVETHTPASVAIESLESQAVLNQDSYAITGEETMHLIFDAQSGQALIQTFVRWFMIHIGSDPNPAPVEGSHGTKIHQLGNSALGDHSTLPTSYDIEARSLAAQGCFDGDAETIRRGVTVPTYTDWGTLSLRALSVLEDLKRPELTRAELGSRRRSADQVRRQRWSTQRQGDTGTASGEVTGSSVRPGLIEEGTQRAFISPATYNATGGAMDLAVVESGGPNY